MTGFWSHFSHRTCATQLLLRLIAAGFLSLFVSAQAISQSALSSTAIKTTQAPVFFAADDLSYSQGGDLVIAKGNVELKQSGRTIRADKMIFSRTTEEVLASGNVIIEDQNGDLLHSDAIALDRDFSRGFVEAIQMKIKPDFEIAGNYAERSGGNRLAVYKTVVTPCPACKKDPSKERSWQIKADQIVVDDKLQQVFYKNVFFEIKGVPVLYLPFFSHADPRVNRKTGFLNPRVTLNSDLGYGLSTPYFVDVNDATNLKFTPTVYLGRFFSDDTNVGDNGFGAFQLETNVKHAFQRGQVDLTTYATIENGSSYLDKNILSANDPNENGAVNVNLSYGFNDTTRLSANGLFYSDREYLNETCSWV